MPRSWDPAARPPPELSILLPSPRRRALNNSTSPSWPGWRASDDGVATAELGYQIRPPYALQRGMQSFGATRAGAWLFSKTLRYADDIVGWLTSGSSECAPTSGRAAGHRHHHDRSQVEAKAQDAPDCGTSQGYPGRALAPTSETIHAGRSLDPRSRSACHRRHRDRRGQQVVARMATAAEETEVWTMLSRRIRRLRQVPRADQWPPPRAGLRA